MAKHSKNKKSRKGRYSLPGIWLDPKKSDSALSLENIDPYKYYLKISKRKSTSKKPPRASPEDWTRNAVIYNMFVRSSAAFDHNGNGKLDLPVNVRGEREIGTFLKAITMLPYVKSLGANVIHLLPITSIGSDGSKGSLGSPYAIRNPLKIDQNLSEPAIQSDVEADFRLFVSEAHRLGMRVVVEFVFRTSAKDGDWVKEHPEWFYWIREEVEDRPPGSHDESQYGNPLFTEDELRQIMAAVGNGPQANLPPPHAVYRDMFTPPPKPGDVRLENGRYVGVVGGRRVRIPGAFADWPPQDTQPPWGDVTYLKLYEHPDFNYIAYNTIRMYDPLLTKPQFENRPLWEAIAGIIPHYQRAFGIDGVMIDMGHALPMELKHEMIRRARELDPGFAFWDENFSVEARSVAEGYNAVIGYQWSDQHHPDRFAQMLRRFGAGGFPLPFFATPESHNTPRAAAREGGVRYSRYAWAVSNFIPAIPFIHSGFELGEVMPVNTGLDFSRAEHAKYPADRLPLFSEYAYDWTRKSNIIGWIRRVSAVRAKYRELIVDASPASFQWIESGHPGIMLFARRTKPEGPALLVAANSDMHHAGRCTVSVTSKRHALRDLLTGASHPVNDGDALLALPAGDVQVFEVA